MISETIILLIYHHPFTVNSPTIMEHVEAFEKYSEFSVIKVNTAHGFPRGLEGLDFSAIVFHYSPFGSHPFLISERFRRYVSSSKAKKIYFFQDEMRYIQQRFALVNQLGSDTIFTLLNPEYFDQIYLKNTSAKVVKQTLTGYVCDQLIEKSSRYFIPFQERVIDVGYRARNLSYHFGRGAREKAEIADRFLEAVKESDLKVDISTREEDRIYGDEWYKFVANCRFMLGVMAGTSIFDMTGEVKQKTDDYLRKHLGASFQDVEEAVLTPYEGNVNYRTISPRLFECAALRVCMILYRDDYQGILTAGRHYIPLEKDFSNIDAVLWQMQDQTLVDQVIDNAYHDLIESGKWHYKEFMRQFDQTLKDLGCDPSSTTEDQKLVEVAINKDAWLRHGITWLKSLRSRSFPGREFIKQVAYNLGYKNGR